MKQLTLLFCTMVIALSGFAQDNNSTQTPAYSPDGYWGVRVALDLTMPGKVTASNNGITNSIDCYNTGAGISFGGIYHMPLVKSLFFEPGLMLYYNTTGIDTEIFQGTSLNGLVERACLKEFGFRVPVLFGLDFTTRFGNISVATGPVFQCGLKGTESITGKSNLSETVSGNMYDGYNRFSVGWKIGVGASINKYYVEISGTPGLTNIHKDSAITWTNGVFQLMVGYNF